MTQFASAAFTGTNGAELSTVDANFSNVGSGTNRGFIENNRLAWDGTNPTGRYKHAASPPSNDYEVSCDLYIVGTTGNLNAGCLARVQSGAGEVSGYFGRFRNGVGWQLFRYDAGTATQLGTTVADTLALNSTTRCRLRVVGSTISLYRGTETTPLIIITDATYASGAAGLIVASATSDGPHIDNWSADTLDIVAGGGTGSSTGSGSGGDATGSAPGQASGGTGTSTGSGTGGAATGTAPNADAQGGTGTSTGSGSGGSAQGGSAVFQIKADGIWTWFTDPRAVHYNGYTYIGWVDSAGNTGITKWNDAAGTGTSFTLHAALEVDDHDNVAIYIRPDGRILAMYSIHNDTSGIRYRISTNPEDITAWGAEVIISAGITLPSTYSNPFYLSKSGKLYNFFRSGFGGVGTNPIGMIESSDQGATWSNPQANFLSNTNARPYVKWCSNGYDRIDFLITNCHPREGASSVYHFYGQLDGSNALQYHKSDGTLIGTSVTPADCTVIYDGATVDGWVWDIAYGRDGNPRVLFTKYPANDGSDIRMMYSRWNGSAWTAPVQLAAMGTNLYPAEVYYTAGACFDSKNPDHVYIFPMVSGVWEGQELRTDDNGATWTKVRDLTTGTTAGTTNARPYSPRNRSDSLAVLFWTGRYTTYSDYLTDIKGAPASFVDASVSAGTGTSTGSGTGGTAAGTTGATAQGGTGTSTGAGSGGAATGTSSGQASGGTGTGTGSGSGGTAQGGTGTDANASGGTGVFSGSGSGGVATGQVSADAQGGIGSSTGSGSGGTAVGGSPQNGNASGGTGTSLGSGTGGSASGAGAFTPGLCNAQIYPSRGVFYVGQAVRVSSIFTSLDGTLIDPTTVVLEVRKPGSLAPAIETIVQDSTGKYHADFEIDTDGLWIWRWEGTGVCDAIDEAYLRAVQSSVLIH